MKHEYQEQMRYLSASLEILKERVTELEKQVEQQQAINNEFVNAIESISDELDDFGQS